jgi:hypothetical protein
LRLEFYKKRKAYLEGMLESDFINKFVYITWGYDWHQFSADITISETTYYNQ